MPFCPSCGVQNAEGAGFCTNCGKSMSAAATLGVPAPAPGTAAPIAPAPMPAPMSAPMAAAPRPYAPAAPAQPNFLSTLWASIDTGARVAAIGGLVAAISFFLPIYEGGGGNGVDMAQSDAAWWFRLILALVAVGLLYFDYNNDLRTRVIVGTAQAAIGTIWGLQIFRIMTGGEFTSGLAFGWYFIHLGFLAIAVGGFMSVLHHTRRLVGVR